MPKGWITASITPEQSDEIDDLVSLVLKRQGDLVSKSRLKTYIADHGRDCGRRGYKTGHLAGSKRRRK